VLKKFDVGFKVLIISFGEAEDLSPFRKWIIGD